jgi:hypothetical protein
MLCCEELIPRSSFINACSFGSCECLRSWGKLGNRNFVNPVAIPHNRDVIIGDYVSEPPELVKIAKSQ